MTTRAIKFSIRTTTVYIPRMKVCKYTIKIINQLDHKHMLYHYQNVSLLRHNIYIAPILSLYKSP